MNEEQKDSLKWMKAGNLKDRSSTERQSILYAAVFLLVSSAVIASLFFFLI